VRFGIAIALVVVALAVAFVLRRRRPQAPTRDAYPVPRQLDRRDFPSPELPWLVAYFSSRSCESCRTVGPRVAALAAPDVVVADLDAREAQVLHERYQISAIPMVLVVDALGVVRASFVGAVASAELTGALAALRGARA
jgi:hypothetical protein